MKERVTAVRGSGGDSSGLEKQAIQATKDLYDMRFLMADSFIDDRYRLLVEIGNGQTSVVWKATDQRSGKPVAIKFLKYKYINDKSIIEGFSKGANTMNTVRHQNIPAVLENYLIIEMGKKGVQLILDAGFEARQHADQQYWKGQCTFSNKRCGFEAGLIE